MPQTNAAPTTLHATTIHGVLMRIQECGVLITGSAGSGKSQLGLELLSRGHRFVADDVISLSQDGAHIQGSGIDESREFLALRCGVVVDVSRQFGPNALLPQSSIDLVVSPGPALAPLASPPNIQILGHDLPQYFVQTLPGAAICVEALAHAWQDRQNGYNAAQELARLQALRLTPNA
jgi:HPr kinase/phosphorylase